MRARRTTRHVPPPAAALLAVCALGLCASAAADASEPTGNARAIAVERSAQTAYGRVPAVSYTESGFATMEAVPTTSSFAWQWGSAFVPAGWVAASEHVVVALRKGRVTWVSDDLSPAGCAAGATCAQSAVEIFVSSAGAFWRFDVPSATCLTSLSGTVPWTIGARWIELGGRYISLTRRRGSEQTRYTFPWGTSQTATAVDTISTRTKLISSERVSVSKGSASQPPFTFKAAYTNLTKAPREPTLTQCS